MASTFKYLADHDRVVASNDLAEIVTNERGTGWMSSSSPPDYFLQISSGSDVFALSERVFDVTFGRSSVATTGSSDLSVEHNIYNQFGKILLGHNADSSIKKFDLDPSDTEKVLHNAFFVNISRSRFKDKIRPNTFDMVVNASGTANVHLIDKSSTVYQCETGHYGLLYASASSISDPFAITQGENDVQGLVFYEAGIAVVSPYIFSINGGAENPSNINDYIADNILGIIDAASPPELSGGLNIQSLISDETIGSNNYGLASRIVSLNYQAITELNSTIYFCRAYNHEFNYSSNPTYLKDSQIIVKGDDPNAPPRTYITTVGLYSDDNQLLAVAKLSEPVLKTPENELIVRTRLDF